MRNWRICFLTLGTGRGQLENIFTKNCYLRQEFLDNAFEPTGESDFCNLGPSSVLSRSAVLSPVLSHSEPCFASPRSILSRSEPHSASLRSILFHSEPRSVSPSPIEPRSVSPSPIEPHSVSPIPILQVQQTPPARDSPSSLSHPPDFFFLWRNSFFHVFIFILFIFAFMCTSLFAICFRFGSKRTQLLFFSTGQIFWEGSSWGSERHGEYLRGQKHQ